jgi:predicted nuclease of restriction endonuclease-like (RecB) superfamily
MVVKVCLCTHEDDTRIHDVLLELGNSFPFGIHQRCRIADRVTNQEASTIVCQYLRIGALSQDYQTSSEHNQEGSLDFNVQA